MNNIRFRMKLSRLDRVLLCVVPAAILAVLLLLLYTQRTYDRSHHRRGAAESQRKTCTKTSPPETNENHCPLRGKERPARNTSSGPSGHFPHRGRLLPQ